MCLTAWRQPKGFVIKLLLITQLGRQDLNLQTLRHESQILAWLPISSLPNINFNRDSETRTRALPHMTRLIRLPLSPTELNPRNCLLYYYSRKNIKWNLFSKLFLYFITYFRFSIHLCFATIITIVGKIESGNKN